MNTGGRFTFLVALATIGCLPLAGCTDFITTAPVSSASTEHVYRTDDDFAQAVVGVYRALQQEYNDMWIYGDIRGDDTWAEVVKDNAAYWSDAFVMNGDHETTNGSWSNYYTAIYRANMVLERLLDVTVANAARHEGEARFLRALAYFNLVRMFGAVPLVTRVINVEEGYEVPRAPVADVYSQVIVSDLQAAQQLLPATYPANQMGRATRGAAAAMLGKVYLTQRDFANAEAQLMAVSNMGYSLLPDYNQVFAHGNPHHSEYIFDIEYQSGIGSGQGNSFAIQFMPNLLSMNNGLYGMTGAGGEFNGPTQHLIDAFKNSPSDLRRAITIAPIGGYYNRLTTYPFQDTTAQFAAFPQATSKTFTLKYVAPMNQGSPANWKVVRYADVVLMLAEAMNENGKTAQAHEFLNQIRKRAGVPAYTGLTQAQFREAIELERRLELAFEGHRWFDLVRWGLAYERLKHRGMLPHMDLYPLPNQQVELINDPSIFPQNPGYD
jgi:hypothetical protein